MVVAEEAVSEEVVAISDWAETLETFLQRKMKPIETRKQLREVNISLFDFERLILTPCSLNLEN